MEGISLVFAVLAVEVLAALAGVSMGGARLAHARRNVLTGVESAGVHAVLTDVSYVTGSEDGNENRSERDARACEAFWLTGVADAAVRAPVVAAVAVLGADVGVAGVFHAAALLHVDFQALSHVHVGHVGGSLAHAHALIDSDDSDAQKYKTLNRMRFEKETKKKLGKKIWQTEATFSRHTPVYSQQILC